MRVLVTGSAGFVGRHFVRALRERGALVKTCDIANSAPPRDCRNRFRFDTSYYDLVLHCAALVDGRETIENKAALLGAYNLQLDGALFEWALKARPGRIVYFSSSAVYPTSLQNHTQVRMLERFASHGAPDQTYGWVKYMGEIVADEVRKAGVPVTVVRPFSGYGEDQDDCYPFPAMIQRAKRKDSPFVVWGDGQQVRDFIHIDDIVRAVLTLVEQGVDGPVNLGTGVPTSMDELARLCMRAVGHVAPIKHLSEKPVGVQYRVADTTLLHRYYTPRVSLEDGVRRAMA